MNFVLDDGKSLKVKIDASDAKSLQGWDGEAPPMPTADVQHHLPCGSFPAQLHQIQHLLRQFLLNALTLVEQPVALHASTDALWHNLWQPLLYQLWSSPEATLDCSHTKLFDVGYNPVRPLKTQKILFCVLKVVDLLNSSGMGSKVSQK